MCNNLSNDDFINNLCTLRLRDKISFIFLVCSDPKEGLYLIHEMKSSISEEHGLFKQFLLSYFLSKKQEFSALSIESLILIKNFRVLSMLGFKKSIKDDLAFSGFVHSFRKYIYLLAESLTKEQTIDFIFSVSGKQSVSEMLEEEVLKWVVKGLVSLELDNTESLRKMTNKLENYGEVARKIKDALCCGIVSSHIDEYYPIINSIDVGYCVVINQENFTRNKEYQHLLPDEILTSRPGSDIDVSTIQDVFTWLGLKVFIHSNVDLASLREILSNYALTIPVHHSLFVLVVMSHGTEDVIYTADSIPVRVEDLEMAFQAKHCPQLVNKPKILIIQACQGKKLQRVLVDGLVSDSKEKKATEPERGDAVIAWSTVKGFASFRDRLQGSWFIQELCSELRRSACTRDFVDIVTRVNSKLRTKTCNGLHMVPSLSLSLCRKIKFPVKSKNPL